MKAVPLGIGFRLPPDGLVSMDVYALMDFQWRVIQPSLPNKPRSVPRMGKGLRVPHHLLQPPRPVA